MLQGNVLVWNCRGVVCNETQRALIDLVQLKKPNLIFLAETLAQPSHIASLANRLGFAGHICYPHEDGSQGLALLWSSEIHVDLRTKSPHHIDVEISDPGKQEKYRFTGLYSFAARSERSRTWDLIRALAAEVCHLPWLMAGDFNEVMCLADKSGGPARAVAPMAAFLQTMIDCGFIDMGFLGSRYTWSNKFTKERLDRSLQSVSFRTMFPNSKTVVLPPNESNHCPIVVELRTDRNRFRTPWRRFRFEEIWHENEQCSDIILKNWAIPMVGNMLQQVGRKILATGKQLMKWHIGMAKISSGADLHWIPAPTGGRIWGQMGNGDGDP